MESSLKHLVVLVNLLTFLLFLLLSVSLGQDDCGYGNISEICCNDFGCCWSTNDTAYAPIGCFNISEILISSSTLMSTETTNLYTTQLPTTTLATTPATTATITTPAATTTGITPAITSTTDSTVVPDTSTTTASPNNVAGASTGGGGKPNVPGGTSESQSAVAMTTGATLTTDSQEATTKSGSQGSGGSVDSYNDPDFPCFDKYIKRSYTQSVIFLTGSYTPQQCFRYCNASYTCRAFQVSRSGSGVCGYFQTEPDYSQFHETTTNSIYVFSSSCVKTPLDGTCKTSRWYNQTYRCTSGLVAAEHLDTEEDCKAYCACGLDKCMAAVVRNSTGTFECYVILEGSDMSNFQLCNVAVKQFITEDVANEILGVTQSPPGTPPKNAPYYNTSCWNPPVVENANHYLYKDAYGMAVVYVCRQGYLFPSGERVRTLVCTNLAWGNIEPICRPTRCTYPPLTYEPFEEIQRSCPAQSGSKDTTPPYFRNGMKVESSKCTVKKLLSELVPRPSECNSTCEAPLLIYNTTAKFLPEDKMADYRCFKGHRFSDGKNKRNVTCFDNGTWPETEPCSALFCDEIPPLKKVVLSTKATIYGSKVAVSCEKGFMFPQNTNLKVIECIETIEFDRITAIWNDTIEACTDVICKNPYTNDTSKTTSTDPNILTKNLYLYMEVIEYVCRDYNLKFDDGTKKRLLTCWDNGVWNFDNVHCGANRCDPIPYITEAVPSTILALKDTKVTFTCNEGFWFEPGVMNMSITCDGALWSQPKYSKCEVVMCPVQATETAQWNTTSNTVPYGTSVKVKCNKGHYLLDTSRESSRTVKCTKFGNWSSDVTCLPVNCGPIVGVGRALIDDDSSTTTTYNSTIYYTCLDGYWFGRDGYQLSARCDEDGNWNVDGITDTRKWRSCIDIVCLPLLTYATSNLTTSVGSSGNVTCPPDRKFKGVVDTVIRAVCNSRGEWMPDLPECIATQSIVNLTIAEAPKADVIAGIAIVIVVVEIACLVLLDLPVIKASFRHLVANLSRLKKR